MEHIIKVTHPFGSFELYTDDGALAANIAAQAISEQAKCGTKVYEGGEMEANLTASYNRGQLTFKKGM